jgi:hypothetical protein
MLIGEQNSDRDFIIATESHQDRMVSALSEIDHQAFQQLQACVASPDCKYARSQMKDVFFTLVQCLISFCHRSETDRSTRYAACGICPLSQTLGVNTQRLAQVLKRSKSSVNAMLCEIGFVPAPSQIAGLSELGGKLGVEIGPDLRRWTIRVFCTSLKPIVLPGQEKDGCPDPGDDGWSVFKTAFGNEAWEFW